MIEGHLNDPRWNIFNMSLNPTTAQVNGTTVFHSESCISLTISYVDPTLTIKSGTVQGGDGGDSFDDFTSTRRVVTEIRVWAGRYIDAIQIVYSDAPAPKRGGNGGNDHTFTVEADDQIVRIDGRGGRYIDQLQFFTKKGDFF